MTMAKYKALKGSAAKGLIVSTKFLASYNAMQLMLTEKMRRLLGPSSYTYVYMYTYTTQTIPHTDAHRRES